MWPFIKKGFVVTALFIFIFLAVNQSASIANYIAGIKDGAWRNGVNGLQTFHGESGTIDPGSLPPNERQLYNRIKDDAKRFKMEPINAKVDPVWKAIPGLNGRELDIDRTFLLAKEMQWAKTMPYIIKEIPPAVTLDDLGAQPIYKGNPRKPMVSLMINVAWKEENIPGMLKTLREERVKATFFFLGSWLKEHPEIAKEIAADGHELSNHAYSHANMSGLSDEKAKSEIQQTQQLLRSTFGVQNRLFAPPSGDFDRDTVRIAHELGLRTVLWTIDTVDWKEPAPESIIRKVSSRLEPGALILMHPTNAASGALKGMIQEIKRQGLSIGTVSQTLSSERVPMVETLPGF